jgi:hypothetical protein
MNRPRKSAGIVLLIVFAMLFVPPTARADAGIPMLPIAYPLVLLFLLPVIAIEAIYLYLKLKTEWRRLTAVTAIANAATLAIGYPLAWLVDFGLELLLSFVANTLDRLGLKTLADKLGWLGFLFPAWLGPSEQLWPVLLAFVVLLLPAYLLSGFVESRIIERFGLPDRAPSGDTVTLFAPGAESLPESRKVRRAVWQANAWSYMFLAAAGMLGLYLQFRHR